MTPKKDSGKKSDLVNEILFEHKWSTPDSLAKGGFSSESVIRFSNLQQKYSKKLPWAWNSKFKISIVFWNIFFGDLKNKSHFLKKDTFNLVK